MEIERNNHKLLERILSISHRKYVQQNFCSGHLMPLGSLTQSRPFSKSLSLDFKRQQANRIVKDNSFLVERLVTKKPFLPISKINKEFKEHQNHLNRIRKMDATCNKMKVRGLEKLSTERLKQLPHIKEISRCQTFRSSSQPVVVRSQSCHNSNGNQAATPTKNNEHTHFSNEFLEDKRC